MINMIARVDYDDDMVHCAYLCFVLLSELEYFVLLSQYHRPLGSWSANIMMMMLSLGSKDSHGLAMVMMMTMKIVIVQCKRLVGVACDGDCDDCDKGSLPIPRVKFCLNIEQGGGGLGKAPI